MMVGRVKKRKQNKHSYSGIWIFGSSDKIAICSWISCKSSAASQFISILEFGGISVTIYNNDKIFSMPVIIVRNNR
jgi:hypothetical protein